MPPICRVCGRHTAGVEVCDTCWRTRPSYDGARAPYFFEGALRKAIHRFKYNRAQHLARPLAALLDEYLTSWNISADVLVPVPLHSQRLAERGYNQAELLAREVAQMAKLPLEADCLQRVRHTESQMGLPAAGRLDNVRGAFACANPDLRARSILLIDDVSTTGATLDACAVALKKGGAASVWALCVAIAK
ncbi:MAG: ComF family protein [Chloroflexi bacterium]|nr:ComF family protein [Chloroflexota bacterium]